MRLQGIDAPELHYRAQKPRGLSEEEKKAFGLQKNFVSIGEQGVSELVNFLNQYDEDGSDIIKAYVFLM